MHLKIKYPGGCFQNLQFLQEALLTNKLSASLPQVLQTVSDKNHLPVFECWRIRAATGDFLVASLVQELSQYCNSPNAFNQEPKLPARSAGLICGQHISLFWGGPVPQQHWSRWPHKSSCPAGAGAQPHAGSSAGSCGAQHRHPNSTTHCRHTPNPPTPTNMVLKPVLALMRALFNFVVTRVPPCNTPEDSSVNKLGSILFFSLLKERERVSETEISTPDALLIYLLCVTAHWMLDQLLITHE